MNDEELIYYIANREYPIIGNKDKIIEFNRALIAYMNKHMTDYQRYNMIREFEYNYNIIND